MDLTPQSAHSLTSPFRYTPTPQPRYECPSLAFINSRYRSTDSLSTLKRYTYPVPGSKAEESEAVHAQAPSFAEIWLAAFIDQRISARASQAAKSALTAEFDPFASFNQPVAASDTHDIYATHLVEITALPVSPTQSGNSPQRSSFPSIAASEVYTQAGSLDLYIPQIKMEHHPQFLRGNEGTIMSLPQIDNNLLITSTSSYSGTLEGNIFQDPATPCWSDIAYPTTSQNIPSITPVLVPLYNRRSESQEQPALARSPKQRRIPSTIVRPRQPRRLTTKEDVNFQCHVKGCGKAFCRSYNFKVHMKTHDASREYPFPCPLKDCTKKFVRKTDLQRHHQSVHMKQRNLRCDYCGRFFARKDTLRR